MVCLAQGVLMIKQFTQQSALHYEEQSRSHLKESCELPDEERGKRRGEEEEMMCYNKLGERDRSH